MGTYGNDNLMFSGPCSFIVADGTSDAGLTLDKDCKAITVYALTDCWVAVGQDPTAVAATEKVWSDSSFVPTNGLFDIPVPAGSDSQPIKVAVIQDSAGGNVYIYQRKDG
jgi:hypothetical protein